MNRVVTHELIHAFDHCRAHVDWFNNFRHLACSEVSDGFSICCIYSAVPLKMIEMGRPNHLCVTHSVLCSPVHQWFLPFLNLPKFLCWLGSMLVQYFYSGVKLAWPLLMSLWCLATPLLFETPCATLSLFTNHVKIFLCNFLQIRAANLSGDCSFSNEFSRFNFGVKQHHQVPALIVIVTIAGFIFVSLIQHLTHHIFLARNVSVVVPYALSWRWGKLTERMRRK